MVKERIWSFPSEHKGQISKVLYGFSPFAPLTQNQVSALSFLALSPLWTTSPRIPCLPTTGAFGLWEGPTTDLRRREGRGRGISFLLLPCFGLHLWQWLWASGPYSSVGQHPQRFSCPGAIRSSNGFLLLHVPGSSRALILRITLWVVPSRKSLHLSPVSQILFPDRIWLKQVSFSNNILWFKQTYIFLVETTFWKKHIMGTRIMTSNSEEFCFAL